jgi:hypothetical protein
VREGKRLASIIKQEAKVEKKALEAAVKELAELQKLQKYAVKVSSGSACVHSLWLNAFLQEEAKTNAAYGHALQTFHKEELIFLAAQAKFERAQADLQAHEDAREAAREHAQQATEMLQEKSREVEWLRAQKAADDVSAYQMILKLQCLTFSAA